MPMSFASLLGGLVTLVGTSPNIIVSQVRQEPLRQAVRDVRLRAGGSGPDGAGRGVPGLRLPAAADADARRPRRSTRRSTSNAYVTEVEVPEDWTSAKPRVGDLQALAAGRRLGDGPDARRQAAGLRRIPNRTSGPATACCWRASQHALDELIARARLKLTRSDRPVAMEEPTEEIRVGGGGGQRRLAAGRRVGPAADLHGAAWRQPAGGEPQRLSAAPDAAHRALPRRRHPHAAGRRADPAGRAEDAGPAAARRARGAAGRHPPGAGAGGDPGGGHAGDRLPPGAGGDRLLRRRGGHGGGRRRCACARPTPRWTARCWC